MEKNLDFESRYWLFGSDRESLQAEYTEKLRLLNALPKTDWHAGFGAATDMMVFGMDDVVVVPEYELGGAPPRPAFLFISNGDKPLRGDVFKHFKKFNVLEYKRPDDPINMRVIHKVLGYANFLIGFQVRGRGARERGDRCDLPRNQERGSLQVAGVDWRAREG